MSAISCIGDLCSIATRVMEPAPSIQDPDPIEMSELCGLEGVETLIVPSDPSIKTFIPFGIDGTSVIISAYGEILRMSQYLAEDETQIICLGSPTLKYYQRDLGDVGDRLHELAQIEQTGIHIHLRLASGTEAPITQTTLVWINGRWPCIKYTVGGLDVSVLFTVDEGILSQRYLITNPSTEQKAAQYSLKIGGAQVNTLHVEGQEWVGAGEHESADKYRDHLPHWASAFYVTEKQWEKASEAMQHNDDPMKITTQNEKATAEAVEDGDDTPKSAKRGQARIALFHNDNLVAPEDAPQTPIPTIFYDSDREEADDEKKTGDKAPPAFSEPLNVVPSGVQKFVVQYSLRPYDESQEQYSRVILPQNVKNLLKREESGNWSFAWKDGRNIGKDLQDDKFSQILRRHLEHIMCLCLVSGGPKSKQQHHIPFINDITFQSASMPINDL